MKEIKDTLPEKVYQEVISKDTVVTWDGEKYLIKLRADVEKVVPFPSAGRLMSKGQEVLQQMSINEGDTLEFEFYPLHKKNALTWSIEVLPDKYKAIANVKREDTGRYILEEIVSQSKEFTLEEHLKWESGPDSSQHLIEESLNQDLREKGIIYGLKPNVWTEFLVVTGEREVVLAEATMPVQPIPIKIIDYVGEPIKQEENHALAIDFFASKLRTCQKDEILAEKISGQEGRPGMNVLGESLPAEPLKILEFKLQKNVYLSEDGMTVRATCAGTPVRINDLTYLVENAYIVSKDVNLETGSIDFPGDVLVGGNVNDGLHVHADGNIKVRGSVASAKLKAEAGVQVDGNIIASKIIIGEKHVNRSRFSKALQELNEDLVICISQVEQLQTVSKDSKVGPLLKVILEKRFPFLASKSQELEQMLNPPDPEFVNKELEVAVRTLKHFLVGLGPLQLEDLRHIKNAAKVTEHFLISKGNMLPANVVCETDYIQNSEIICAGNFICRKGAYNSSIKAGGSIKIFGIFRGGEISCTGDIYIWELGGPSISSTVIRASKGSRINVEYCHGNIKVYLGKELVSLDDYVQKLEIYRENGIVQVEKIKWDGRN